MKSSQEPKFDAVRGRIVNRETGKAIPDDEPIFILRASDINMVKTLRDYKKLCSNGNHKKCVQARINQVVAFQKEHKDRVKEPDTMKVDLYKELMEV